jgi:stearoyl-CoA desaturase (delta-9 desaturase)
VSALVQTFTTLPFSQLRRNRYFYLWYDAAYAALCVVALAAMHAAGHQGVITTWSWWYLLALPVVTHLQILCSVFVHVCTHGSFPRAVNRLIGEICGVVILTRFASWEIIHQRHHRYSDDVEKDPHPIVKSYWDFVGKTIVNVEKQLQQTYFDLYGDTAETRRYEKLRAYVSYATNLLLIYTWFTFLGPSAFFFLFVPASVIGALHLFHFNWSTHNAFSPTSDFKPVNLDHGFYWVGNRIWFGIYFHGNHHKNAKALNPRFASPQLPVTRPPTATEIGAATA